jgi:diadenosine tetraphosphatase ApaH/serine/threonine PP2A family protein phosphatase
MVTRIHSFVVACVSVVALTYGSGVAARVLQPGERLVAGQVMYSDEGRYLATLQHDGNFVVYRNAMPLRPIWSTNTTGRGAVTADMQGDGNFVLYDRGRHPIWSAGSNGPNRAFTINELGQAVVVTPGQVHWSTPGALLPLYHRLRVTPVFMSDADKRPGPGSFPLYCTGGWKVCDARVRHSR